jgi:hypothetical protein
LTNLPPLPPQEAYYVWAFTKDKKIFCGKFNTNASGELVAQLPIPVHEYNSRVLFMRISQEPATLPATPHQKVLVMTSESTSKIGNYTWDYIQKHPQETKI